MARPKKTWGIVKIRSARLCNYRNVGLSEADLDAQSVWVCGANAQGKTNLLEAVGLLGALRSFRTPKASNLIRHGEKAAQALFSISHETMGDCSVLVEISQNGRRVCVDGDEQRRLADFIGRFPVTALSSDDIKLVRGAPAERRRFADMLISSLDPEYFENLRAYHAALAQRNALLRSRSADAASFDAFEREMARRGAPLSASRARWLDELAGIAGLKYSALSGGREAASVRLRASSGFSGADEFLGALARERPRDALLGTTSFGPHRDDFCVSVDGKGVREFASEGQQRSVALALRLAQHELAWRTLNVRPLLLCDDILGELDESRRRAFWEAADPDAQLVATSTSELPENSSPRRGWKTVRVSGGTFSA